MIIEFQIIDPRLGVEFPLPQYASEEAAGIDLVACLDAPCILEPNHTQQISSGIAIALPSNQVGLIMPRSGLGHRHGIILSHGTGVIDPDYRGTLVVSLWNRSGGAYTVHPGDRIAQLLIMPISRPLWKAVPALSNTARDQGGFGSTGR